MAIDERTLKALLPDPAIEFIGRLLGSRDRQGSKRCEPLWILVHGVDEEIVRFAGDRDLLRHVGLFDAWRIEREYLHVDAGSVHLGDTPVADVLELRQDFRAAGAHRAHLR